jgi:hypothetical protein
MSGSIQRSAVKMMMVAGGLLAAAPALSGCAMVCSAMSKKSMGACGAKCQSAGATKCGAKCQPAAALKCGAKCSSR